MMPWFNVDDGLSSHPKTRAAGLPAIGLWTVAGSWASHYLTEGYVPEWFVVSWPQGKRLAAALVSAGLWHEADGGWQFHQWEERNRTKEEVETDRAAARARQKNYRDKRRSNGVSNGVTDSVTNAVSHTTQALPIQSEPEASNEASTTSMPRKRATRLPDDWKPTEKDTAWQHEHGIDDVTARREAEKFRDYWRAKAGRDATKIDWSATWRNWLRNVLERTPQRPGAQQSRAIWDA
jgi:hypothetical protein